MAQVRVVRKGVTPTEVVTVLGRRLGGGFEVVAEKQGEVLVRRSLLSAAVVRIDHAPGATVFRVRGAGMPIVSFSTSRAVANALRKSPEFRSV
jgi:hypothetical protein